MAADRRSFIKKFGVTLGSLIVSGSLPGCGPKKGERLPGTGTQVGRRTGPPQETPVPSTPEWRQLGQCWLDLKTLNAEVTEASKRPWHLPAAGEEGPMQPVVTEETIRQERIARHQALIAEMVATGQLEEPVGKCMQLAFEEAAFHIIRSMATCYSGARIGYAPREDLLQQATLLNRIDSGLDRLIIKKARAAIAQDLAFLEMIKSDITSYWTAEDSYIAADLKPDLEALKAAQLLTRLFLDASDSVTFVVPVF